MSHSLFVSHVLTTLEHWGVDVELSAKQQVHTLPNQQGLACSGFFTETPYPKLAVATGKNKKEWLAILAHEFSHACQWKEQDPLWVQLFDDWGYGREEASDALDRWLDGEEWSNTTLCDVIARIRDIELDCEKRTIQWIKTFKLPIDIEEYTQKANSYVYFYNQVQKTRRWYDTGQAPYQLERVWKSAPIIFLDQKETPSKLQEAFDQHYPVSNHSKRLHFK